MNTFRIISQTFLMTVLFVGSVSAMDTTQKVSKLPKGKIPAFVQSIKHTVAYNPGIIPIVGAFVAVNCGKDATSNKIASTLVKTAYYGANTCNIEKAWRFVDHKAVAGFAIADLAIRYGAEQIAATAVVKSALESVERVTGKTFMRLSKEVAVGFAAYGLVKQVSKLNLPANPFSR